MRFLLDTCVLIWYMEGSEKISSRLREDLTDPRHELLMSEVSVLEVVIKYGAGKLPLPKPPSKLLPVLARKHLMDSLPLTGDAIFKLETLPLLHKDPFDRLLIAQALVYRLTIVTPDIRIQQYDVDTLWV